MESLQLQRLEDQVVATVLQELFAKVLRWVQVLAGRVFPLALALQQANHHSAQQEQTNQRKAGSIPFSLKA